MSLGHKLSLQLGRQSVFLWQLIACHQAVTEAHKLERFGRSNPRTGKGGQQDHGEMKEHCFKCHGGFPRLARMPQCGEASVPQI